MLLFIALFFLITFFAGASLRSESFIICTQWTIDLGVRRALDPAKATSAPGKWHSGRTSGPDPHPRLSTERPRNPAVGSPVWGCRETTGIFGNPVKVANVPCFALQRLGPQPAPSSWTSTRWPGRRCWPMPGMATTRACLRTGKQVCILRLTSLGGMEEVGKWIQHVSGGHPKFWMWLNVTELYQSLFDIFSPPGGLLFAT